MYLSLTMLIAIEKLKEVDRMVNKDILDYEFPSIIDDIVRPRKN